MKITRKQNIWTYALKNFNLETLVCESQLLKRNALKDPHLRFNPVMIPKKPGFSKKGFPVVIVLSGFTGNGPYAVALNRNGEENHLQQLDKLVEKKQAPAAVYVFVDALTRLGGSQFLNSPATGNYESYIIEELIPAVKKYYPVRTEAEYWCVTGTSSGGYGALHLASKYPKIFGYAAALAPDCDFESCYFQDLLAAAQFISESGGFKSAVKKISENPPKNGQRQHQILNGLAMAACYSAEGKTKINFPLDLDTGKWRSKVLKLWKSKDPLTFLVQRGRNVRNLAGIYLGAGRRDEFFLNFGARKLVKTFKKLGVPVKYEEFGGGHFDLSKLRPNLYTWLKKKWN